MKRKISIIMAFLILVTSVISFSVCLNTENNNEEKENIDVDLNISEPKAFEGLIGVKATVKGEKSNYNLILKGPNSSKISTYHIKKTDMTEEEYTVFLSISGLRENPQTGKYQIELVDKSGKKAPKIKNFTYDGPDIEVTDFYFEWKTYEEYDDYYFKSLNVNISNSGDVGFITNIHLEIGGDFEYKVAGSIKGWNEFKPVLSNSDQKFSTILFDFTIPAGNYPVEVKISDKSGKIRGSYNKAIDLPKLN